MRTKQLLAVLTASLLLATAVSIASARNLSISNQSIRTTWTSLEFSVLEVAIRCPVTFEGSFHIRTIAKVVRSLIGAITTARVGQPSCTGGIATAFNGVERYNGLTPSSSLPWHLTYHGFIGRLPNIELIGLLFSRFRFGFRDSGGLCTGQYGTAEDNMIFDSEREAGGGISGIRPTAGSNRATLFRRDGGLLCPSPGTVIGNGALMQLGTTTRITVTLI